MFVVYSQDLSSNELQAMSPRAPVYKPRAKVVGSNPAPATNFKASLMLVFLCQKIANTLYSALVLVVNALRAMRPRAPVHKLPREGRRNKSRFRKQNSPCNAVNSTHLCISIFICLSNIGPTPNKKAGKPAFLITT